MPRRFANNVPQDLALKMRTHMEQCGYSKGTVEMRIGNLGYLIDTFGTEKIEAFLSSNNATVNAAIEYISDNLPPGGVHHSDVQAFKLAWESIHGEELFKKRVASSKSDLDSHVRRESHMLNLMKLFDGYVRNYHTLNLTETHGRHSFTMAEIEYFFRLGSMLGYHSFTEDTCDGAYRPMDLTWWDDWDGEGWNRLVLHLERENLFEKDEETLEKLFGQRGSMPENVIGIMNVSDHERIQHLTAVAQRSCPIPNALLIFRTYSPDKPLPYFDDVHAYLLNRHEVMDSQQARISLTGSTFFMQLINDRS